MNGQDFSACEARKEESEGGCVIYILSEKALKRVIETNFTNHGTEIECRCLPERDCQQGYEEDYCGGVDECGMGSGSRRADGFVKRGKRRG